MVVLSKEKIRELILECIKKTGHLPVNDSFDPSMLEELHKSTVVNCIKSKFKQYELSVILSETKLAEFHSIDDLIDWCYKKQQKIKR